jgi:signal transduction histidine kinase
MKGRRLTLDLARRNRGVEYRPELDLIEAAFGAEVAADAAQGAVNAARRRAWRRTAAAGGVTENCALAFAADVLVALAVERPWEQADVYRVMTSLRRTLDVGGDTLIAELMRASLRAPELLELAPSTGLAVQLQLLVALSPATEASLWCMQPTDGSLECVAATPAGAPSQQHRNAARAALDGEAAAAGSLVGVPLSRLLTPWGALVAGFEADERRSQLLEEVADAMRPIIERDALLDRSSARENALVRACERRLGRLAFDLHDGALQHVAALRADIALLRSQLGDALPSEQASPLRLRGDDLDARTVELDRVLRELAHSLEPVSLVRRPLADVLATEVAAFRERTAIDAKVAITGELGDLTPSQKIALIRVAQEALTNIREHAGASRVAITLTASRLGIEMQVEDDGQGFDVATTLQAAARRGRLGLVGSSERVRLLGGAMDVQSRPGGPTVVVVGLPRWQPLTADAESNDLSLAVAGD